MQQLDERVVNMYKSIREILTKYRSGKLPKAFKIIPSLRNWEQVFPYTVELLWLKHLWNHENMCETGGVHASEC